MISGSFFRWKAVSFSAVVIIQLVLSGTQAKAQRVVAGTVTDSLTGAPIADAVVTIKYLDQEIGKGTTDSEGHYRVPLGVPAPTPNQGPASMSLSVSDGSHKDRIVSLQVVNGHAVEPTNDIALLIPAIASCLSESKHSVIVGHFLPPVDHAYLELSEHLATALDYSLNVELQKVHLDKTLQPDFEPCSEAKLKTAKLGKKFARAVKADAFVSGTVGSGPPYAVTTEVSDAFELFDRPESTTSQNVDIDNPTTAILKLETHAAVLGSVAAGLATKDDCDNSLAVISVAKRIVKDVPKYLFDLQHRCQGQPPNNGLLGSNP
jgi:hypothetical protein